MIGLLLALGFHSAAHAYLPPAFYVYGQIAESRAKNPPVEGLRISLSRPKGAGTEEGLGSFVVAGWSPSTNGWPSLSLLLSPQADSIIRSVTAFGIPVAKENELLRGSREQLAAMREPPRPYYRPDKRMTLKRHRQSYAWVHRESGREVWLEKDSMIPLKIVGPCPREVIDLSWAQSGENRCELEFRNAVAVGRGALSSVRMLLWKDGAPLLFFSFDKASARADGGEADGALSEEAKAAADILLH